MAILKYNCHCLILYRSKKNKARSDENHIYETPVGSVAPTLPPRNDVEMEMKANNAYSTGRNASVQTSFEIRFDSSNPDHLKMAINSAYSAVPASDAH